MAHLATGGDHTPSSAGLAGPVGVDRSPLTPGAGALGLESSPVSVLIQNLAALHTDKQTGAYAARSPRLRVGPLGDAAPEPGYGT